MNLLKSPEASDYGSVGPLILHQDCVPYMPFTRDSALNEGVEIIGNDGKSRLGIKGTANTQ
jgi:hypothetical protein